MQRRVIHQGGISSIILVSVLVTAGAVALPSCGGGGFRDTGSAVTSTGGGGGAVGGATSAAGAPEAGSTSTGGTCSAGAPGCNTCDAVVPADGMTLHVDPVAGDDALGNGSGTAGGVPRPGCAYQSITRAVAVAAAVGQRNLQIVVDVTSTASPATGEVFPISLPAGTTIATAPGVVVTVQVASGIGFQVPHDGSTIRSLVVDGQGAASVGILVSGGVQANPNTLAGVEVKGFTSAGVQADHSAVLTVTAAANVHDNGTANAAAPGAAGLVALDSAVVTVDGVGASEQTPTQFSHNTGRGIGVHGQAQVNLTGSPSSLTAGSGTVVVKGNTLAGVYVEQLLVAQGTAGPAGMSMTGLVSTLNGTYGLHLFGGSGVKVRASYLSNNVVHGVYIQTNPAFVSGGSGANDGNDLSRLDLGATGDSGKNVLQDAASPNGSKGVCLDLSGGSNTGGLLELVGNVFAAGADSIDCSRIAGSLPATGDCAAAGPLGDVGRNPRNDFDVSQCTVR